MSWRRACVPIAALLTLLLAGTASATTTGIDIVETLATERGTLTFQSGATNQTCAVTLTKTFIAELVPVSRELTKIGKIESGTIANCMPAFATTLLNLPAQLGGRPVPGPAPSSWDIAFISSNLQTGDMNIAILDFQVRITSGFICLYRGTVTGVLVNRGDYLTLVGVLPVEAGSSGGCPRTLTVTGTLFDTPLVHYVLLTT